MADFVKLDGYNVKDALAGKSLSISGDQLSLLKADGTAASTVTIPSDTIYTVSLVYTDTTVTGNVSDLYSIMKAGTGSWSLRVSPALPAGTTLSSVNKIFIGLVELPNAIPASTRIGPDFPGTSGLLPMAYFLVPDDLSNGTHFGGIVTLCIVDQDNGTIWDWGYTDLSSGSNSTITSANIRCSGTSLSTLASSSPVNAQVDEVIIDGQVGQQVDLLQLLQLIVAKFSNAPGADIKMSITGRDWSAEILNYSLSGSTATIYFEVCNNGVSYRKYAAFDASSYNSLTINQAQ